MPGGRADVVPVLLPARHVLRDEEIVGLEAEPRPGRRRNRHEARFPALGQHRRPLADSLGVVAVGVVEGRELADRALDELGPLGVVPGVDVDVRRDEQLGRRLRVAPEDRLASDHDDLGVAGNRRRGPDHVLELGRFTAPRLRAVPAARRPSASGHRGNRRMEKSGGADGRARPGPPGSGPPRRPGVRGCRATRRRRASPRSRREASLRRGASPARPATDRPGGVARPRSGA